MGLMSAQAAVLLEQHGVNAMPRKKGRPAWRELVAQMTHFFALMLWAAATGVAVLLVDAVHKEVRRRRS